MQSIPTPYSYKAACEKDEFTGKRRVMFFATAVDIMLWSGIPQKMIIDGNVGAETIGFQRVENTARVEEISKFYSARNNISHNPILCAVKSPSDQVVTFTALPNDQEDKTHTQHGYVEINLTDLKSQSFATLFGMLKKSLDSRLEQNPENAEPTDQEITELKKSLFNSETPEDLDDSESSDSNAEDSDSDFDEVPSVESHIIQFRKAIAIRESLCIEGAAKEDSEFAGFSKDRLISFLLPIVLVDGQHRLRGAWQAAHSFLEEPDMAQKQKEIFDSLSVKFVGAQLAAELEKEKFKLLSSVSPILSISLLLDADPAEQVFQFVVVNQKAVPVGKALLGTIVSTTLSDSELEQVRTRLNMAGIPLENSRAITKLVVQPNSPFFNKVDRGLRKEAASELLQWNVLSGLIQIARNLKGARLYHEDRGPDYASYWKEAYLSKSKIIEKYSDLGFKSPAEYWGSENGPWEQFFTSFFNEVKERLANETSEESNNYWGRPIKSNLFNKIYLNILLADFFNFLYTKEQIIDSVSQIPNLVETWLSGASADYFAKPWGLVDQKKDSTTIKKKWATLWHNYRRSPISMKRIPSAKQFA
jgi:hypothetical protein